MAEERMVVLNRSDSLGFGFSLLDKAGLPHIIYKIEDNSPAARCGELETGDVILKVNGTDVNRFTTKEVLKCLRHSSNSVTLRLKRDPQLKARVGRYLCTSPESPEDMSSEYILPSSDKKASLNHNTQQSSHYNIRNAKSNHYSSSSPSPEEQPLLKNDSLERASRTSGNNSNSSSSNNSSSITTSTSSSYTQQSPPKSNGCSRSSSKNSTANGCTDWSDRSNKGARDKNSSNGWVGGGLGASEGGGSNNCNRISHRTGESHIPVPVKHSNRFEAYMMTGELMLKLSRTERSGEGVLGGGPPPHPHRHHHAPRHRNPDYGINTYNSTPVSPIDSRLSGGLSSPQTQRYNSTPASTTGLDKVQQSNIPRTLSSKQTMPDPSAFTFNSTPTSPSDIRCGRALSPAEMQKSSIPTSHHVMGCVRTSRSEDHLQKESSMSAVAIDIDEDDVTSSLNTLLDTRPESRNNSNSSGRHQTPHATDRIVWTYNAPVSSSSERNVLHYNGSGSNTAHSNSTSVSEGISPQRSLSPASPTSMSSSVMSSTSVSSRTPPSGGHHSDSKSVPHPQLSISEAVSNISSPDYQDPGVDMFNGRECMEVSDPSDSDSTILVSEPCNRRVKSAQGGNPPYMTSPDPACALDSNSNRQDGLDYDHRIVIQVKGPEKDRLGNVILPSSPSAAARGTKDNHNGELEQHTPEAQGYQELRDEECVRSTCSSPEEAGSEADADSLHSFHYSPKAVDIPSAIRLAKRLHGLDGFKKSDVSRHLSKNNDFSRAVAEEYLKYFNFEKDTLDNALRKFLKQFCLTGETQERERVLVHFSRRYLDCNPGTFNSQDAVHTLTCAIMLLNTDLHGQNIGRTMSCTEFIENLADLNDGANFPRDILKALYHAIKSHPLEWAIDSDGTEGAETSDNQNRQSSEPHPATRSGPLVGSNPFLDVPDRQHAVEYKKGYVMRKCCIEANGKKTPFGKRGWKMFYCTLRDLILYLHKDEHGFRKSQMSDNLHNAIRIHHSLATKATDYTKKQHVFRLQTADQAEYLFQTSDSKELQSWIDTINFVCAAFSAQPLAGAVGSQRKFQRPLLPCSHTKLTLREQLRDHEERCEKIEAELKQPRSSGSSHHNREKETYLQNELKRYRTYAYLLKSRVAQYGADNVTLGGNGSSGNNPSTGVSLIGEMDETEAQGESLRPPPLPDRNPSRETGG